LVDTCVNILSAYLNTFVFFKFYLKRVKICFHLKANVRKKDEELERRIKEAQEKLGKVLKE